MIKHFIYLVAFLFLSCAVDRSTEPANEEDLALLAEFEVLDDLHKVQIGPTDEPGQTLILCLTLIDKESKSPLIQQPIDLYHTNSEGDYEPADLGDEASARLNGTGITDQNGRVVIRTILPGGYGSNAGNRHIHTTVKNANPEFYDINFKQHIGRMGRNFTEGSDQHFLADLKAMEDGALLTFVTMEIKK